MTWGHRARHVDEGLPEAEHARLARLASPDVSGRSRSTAPPHVNAALSLQHSAGNAAVVQLIRAARAGAGGGQIVAQRQDEDEEDAGQGWASDDTSSSSYAGGEAGGEAAYGPPPPPDYGDAGGGGQSWASGEAAPAAGEEPATEPAAGGGAGAGGSDWSGGGGGGGGEAGGADAAPTGEQAPGGDEGGGSSWWPFGGEETPRNQPGEAAPGGDEGGGSSWWPFGGGDDEVPAGGEEPGQNDSGDHSADDQQAKMDEGEIGVVSDPFVPTSGSPVHGASGDRSGAGGFHDGGRRGTVPFRAETAEDHEDGLPHAITTGGKTGTRVWGGGGGAGPKGNQHTGTFSKQVEPKYDTDWGGIATNASAWVIPGTGIFDVHRDYMTSDAGDQGNGWWVSPLAAAALEAHEQRHLQAARDVYSSTIDPMLDRISKSKSVGYRTDYRSVNAVALLQKYVGWKSSIDHFSEQDAQWNADQGQIDQEDLASTRYPVPMKGPKTIEGKEYQAYEIMQGEKPA